MFGFSFRSLAEAALSTFTAPLETDQELDTLLNEAKSQESSFTYYFCYSSFLYYSGLQSIMKEVEKQIAAISNTNSLILRQMDMMDNETHNHQTEVNIWKTASVFYHTIGTLKENVIPNIVLVKLWDTN